MGIDERAIKIVLAEENESRPETDKPLCAGERKPRREPNESPPSQSVQRESGFLSF